MELSIVYVFLVVFGVGCKNIMVGDNSVGVGFLIFESRFFWNVEIDILDLVYGAV